MPQHSVFQHALLKEKIYGIGLKSLRLLKNTKLFGLWKHTMIRTHKFLLLLWTKLTSKSMKIEGMQLSLLIEVNIRISLIMLA